MQNLTELKVPSDGYCQIYAVAYGLIGAFLNKDQEVQSNLKTLVELGRFDGLFSNLKICDDEDQFIKGELGFDVCRKKFLAFLEGNKEIIPHVRIDSDPEDSNKSIVTSQPIAEFAEIISNAISDDLLAQLDNEAKTPVLQAAITFVLDCIEEAFLSENYYFEEILDERLRNFGEIQRMRESEQHGYASSDTAKEERGLFWEKIKNNYLQSIIGNPSWLSHVHLLLFEALYGFHFLMDERSDFLLKHYSENKDINQIEENRKIKIYFKYDPSTHYSPMLPFRLDEEENLSEEDIINHLFGVIEENSQACDSNISLVSFADTDPNNLSSASEDKEPDPASDSTRTLEETYLNHLRMIFETVGEEHGLSHVANIAREECKILAGKSLDKLVIIDQKAKEAADKFIDDLKKGLYNKATKTNKFKLILKDLDQSLKKLKVDISELSEWDSQLEKVDNFWKVEKVLLENANKYFTAPEETKRKHQSRHSGQPLETLKKSIKEALLSREEAKQVTERVIEEIETMATVIDAIFDVESLNALSDTLKERTEEFLRAATSPFSESSSEDSVSEPTIEEGKIDSQGTYSVKDAIDLALSEDYVRYFKPGEITKIESAQSLIEVCFVVNERIECLEEYLEEGEAVFDERDPKLEFALYPNTLKRKDLQTIYRLYIGLRDALMMLSEDSSYNTYSILSGEVIDRLKDFTDCLLGGYNPEGDGGSEESDSTRLARSIVADKEVGLLQHIEFLLDASRYREKLISSQAFEESRKFLETNLIGFYVKQKKKGLAELESSLKETNNENSSENDSNFPPLEVLSSSSINGSGKSSTFDDSSNEESSSSNDTSNTSYLEESPGAGTTLTVRESSSQPHKKLKTGNNILIANNGVERKIAMDEVVHGFERYRDMLTKDHWRFKRGRFAVLSTIAGVLSVGFATFMGIGFGTYWFATTIGLGPLLLSIPYIALPILLLGIAFYILYDKPFFNKKSTRYAEDRAKEFKLSVAFLYQKIMKGLKETSRAMSGYNLKGEEDFKDTVDRLADAYFDTEDSLLGVDALTYGVISLYFGEKETDIMVPDAPVGEGGLKVDEPTRMASETLPPFSANPELAHFVIHRMTAGFRDLFKKASINEVHNNLFYSAMIKAGCGPELLVKSENDILNFCNGCGVENNLVGNFLDERGSIRNRFQKKLKRLKALEEESYLALEEIGIPGEILKKGDNSALRDLADQGFPLNLIENYIQQRQAVEKAKNTGNLLELGFRANQSDASEEDVNAYFDELNNTKLKMARYVLHMARSLDILMEELANNPKIDKKHVLELVVANLSVFFTGQQDMLVFNKPAIARLVVNRWMMPERAFQLRSLLVRSDIDNEFERYGESFAKEAEKQGLKFEKLRILIAGNLRMTEADFELEDIQKEFINDVDEKIQHKIMNEIGREEIHKRHIEKKKHWIPNRKKMEAERGRIDIKHLDPYQVFYSIPTENSDDYHLENIHQTTKAELQVAYDRYVRLPGEDFNEFIETVYASMLKPRFDAYEEHKKGSSGKKSLNHQIKTIIETFYEFLSEKREDYKLHHALYVYLKERDDIKGPVFEECKNQIRQTLFGRLTYYSVLYRRNANRGTSYKKTAEMLVRLYQQSPARFKERILKIGQLAVKARCSDNILCSLNEYEKRIRELDSQEAKAARLALIELKMKELSTMEPGNLGDSKFGGMVFTPSTKEQFEFALSQYSCNPNRELGQNKIKKLHDNMKKFNENFKASHENGSNQSRGREKPIKYETIADSMGDLVNELRKLYTHAIYLSDDPLQKESLYEESFDFEEATHNKNVDSSQAGRYISKKIRQLEVLELRDMTPKAYEDCAAVGLSVVSYYDKFREFYASVSIQTCKERLSANGAVTLYPSENSLNESTPLMPQETNLDQSEVRKAIGRCKEVIIALAAYSQFYRKEPNISAFSYINDYIEEYNLTEIKVKKVDGLIFYYVDQWYQFHQLLGDNEEKTFQDVLEFIGRIQTDYFSDAHDSKIRESVAALETAKTLFKAILTRQNPQDEDASQSENDPFIKVFLDENGDLLSIDSLDSEKKKEIREAIIKAYETTFCMYTDDEKEAGSCVLSELHSPHLSEVESVGYRDRGDYLKNKFLHLVAYLFQRSSDRDQGMLSLRWGPDTGEVANCMLLALIDLTEDQVINPNLKSIIKVILAASRNQFRSRKNDYLEMVKHLLDQLSRAECNDEMLNKIKTAYLDVEYEVSLKTDGKKMKLEDYRKVFPSSDDSEVSEWLDLAKKHWMRKQGMEGEFGCLLDKEGDYQTYFEQESKESDSLPEEVIIPFDSDSDSGSHELLNQQDEINELLKKQLKNPLFSNHHKTEEDYKSDYWNKKSKRSGYQAFKRLLKEFHYLSKKMGTTPEDIRMALQTVFKEVQSEGDGGFDPKFRAYTEQYMESIGENPELYLHKRPDGVNEASDEEFSIGMEEVDENQELKANIHSAYNENPRDFKLYIKDLISLENQRGINSTRLVKLIRALCTVGDGVEGTSVRKGDVRVLKHTLMRVREIAIMFHGDSKPATCNNILVEAYINVASDASIQKHAFAKLAEAYKQLATELGEKRLSPYEIEKSVRSQKKSLDPEADNAWHDGPYFFQKSQEEREKEKNHIQGLSSWVSDIDPSFF